MKKVSYHLGINKYPSSIWGKGANLSGCINDARGLFSLFKANGFESTILTDEAVTTKSFTELVEKIALDVKEGIVVITYSGHGIDSQVLDKVSGRKQTITGICLTNRIFWDFEFKNLLSKFSKDVTVIWISDSCFSEGNYRKVDKPLKKGHKERFISWDKIKQIWRDIFQREAEIQSFLVLPDDRIKCKVISLMSSQDTETSLEVNSAGIFTSSLLRNVKGGTWRDVLSLIERDVIKKTKREQHPAYEILNIPQGDVQALMKKPFLIL